MHTQQIHISNLKVNDQINPLAVEKSKVQFSWNVSAVGRYNFQSAYRIIISSTEKKLKSENGDVWDSGKVCSSDSLFIGCPDCLLSSNERYWWKVIIWDKNGCMHESGKVAFFDTGLEPQDWTSKWIWKSSNIQINSFAYFRKEIELKDGFSQAKVFVSAHNHFKLFINGNTVGGYVSPAPTHPEKSKYYLTYDITGLLKAGKNALCAMAHYIGGDGQNYVNGLPGFIMQVKITGVTGEEIVFSTDESWKVLSGTPYTDGALFQQNRRITAIEQYNSNREPDGWLVEGFDDSAWGNAVSSSINSNNWVMKPQDIPEGVIDEIILPDAISIQEVGLQVFDAGKIISGWPILELKGVKDIPVRMRYSENLDTFGRVGHNVANETSENYFDEYIMNGREKECWSPDFSYKAFRYVEVTGYPEIIKPGNIKIASAHTNVELSGRFHSSNKLFNDIYSACIQTQKNNTLGQLVDCPHREQAQYLADSDLHAETLSYYFSSRNVLEKVLSDFSDAQLQDGTFPFVSPSNYFHTDFNVMIPEWDLHFCTLMWKIYYTFGDKSILSRNYAAAETMIKYYLDSRDSKTGLVPKSKGRWHISDWPYPNIVHEGDFLTVQNCKVYNALSLLSKTAGILGMEESMHYYSEQAEALKRSIVKHLYDPDRKVFLDSSGCSESHQGTNVIAFQYGIVPIEDTEEILEHIVRVGHECKTLLSLNLFQILFENGKGEVAYKLLNNAQYPGWGHMISKGYKTIWEGFDDIESHSHAWNAYPARLFMEYIAGIKPALPGFAEIAIKPFMPEDMGFAEGSITTAIGDIFSKWAKTAEGFSMEVKIPANTNAKVYFPVKKQKALIIRESGEIIWNAGTPVKRFNEIDLFELENEIVAEIRSGLYIFEVIY